MAASRLSGKFDIDNKDGEQHKHWNNIIERLHKPILYEKLASVLACRKSLTNTDDNPLTLTFPDHILMGI